MDAKQIRSKRIIDRDINTLIGLSMGIVSDGEIVKEEAEYLLGWLIQSECRVQIPLVSDLRIFVQTALESGSFSKSDSLELYEVLLKLTGEGSDHGELAKPSTIPLCDPAPDLVFMGKIYVFTGKFNYGTRDQCHLSTASLGAICSTRVTRKLDYLVIGSYVTDSWMHESFGNKIIKAMNYRNDGQDIAIVSENTWLRARDAGALATDNRHA